ncbi:hypothetical protein N9I85_03440 [Gammaproteobacteria bacterium]|nr:hypothetical protein [Gammaproteobacteria bacterium]
MNEETQIQIIELMDDGATLESSLELKALVEASEEATKFYESLLVSESMLEGFFGGEKAKELDKKIDAFIDEQLEKPSNISSINFKPFIGFAVAASLAVIAFTFVNSPAEILEPVAPVQIAYEEPTPVVIEEVIEEPEPMFVAGSDMDTLWSTATQIAIELGVDRYQVMYALYEANKDFFVNNNINAPRADRNYFVDLAIIESVDPIFASREVKNHIFCSC